MPNRPHHHSHPRSADLTIRQVLPRGGPSIVCDLASEGPAYGPAQAGGSGGLQIVDLPRRKSAVQWYDAPVWQLTLDIILNNMRRDVEHECHILEHWMDNDPGATDAPVLKIGGPTPGTHRYWQLQNIAFGNAIRNGALARTQQMATLTLWEYSPVLQNFLSASSPAKRGERAIREANGLIPSRKRYHVRSGDTLRTIAARQLGDYRLWTQIATLNGIRDPNSITAGQILVLP